MIMDGHCTHNDTLSLVGELANLSEDYDYIERVITAAFPESYSGNSLKELPGMIRDTSKKFETGLWTRSKLSRGSAPTFSEEHLAQEFAARHGDEFRHVTKSMGWMHWDGKCWREDEKRKVFWSARVVCQEFAVRASKGLKRSIASAKTRAAVVSLAQDDERIAVTADQWDADLWLLNTPNGTIDLRTGQLRPHDPENYITKITAVTPAPNCPTTLWKAFLEKVTRGDGELQAYLQRAAGYMLTGTTIEHALFFFYGTGANGKSVFIKTITAIANDYARVVPMEALMWSRNERHPTDLAGLRGARIGSAIETGNGRNWDEPKIMLLTGGDKISARLMRQDFFDFVPQFKLIVAGNHKPGLRSVNEAIRRRLHMVPFTVTVPPEERDPQLGEKLKVEWSGILSWMIDGCLEWGDRGLAPPKIVTEATEDYLETQDTLAEFIGDCCQVDKNFDEQSSQLYTSWKHWCEEHGEKPGHQRAFNDALEQKGFKRNKEERGYVFRGLRVSEAERQRQFGEPGPPF